MTDTAMGHQAGAANGNIWEVSNASSQHITYGPFYDLPANKNYRADFVLAINGTVSPTDSICLIDVVNGLDATIMIEKTLIASDFSGQNIFQTFSLAFSSTSVTLPMVQFRVRYLAGTVMLREDATTVTEVP